VRNIARNSQQHHSNSNSNAQPVRDIPKKLESTYSTYASSRVSSRANSTKPAQRRACPYLEQTLPPRASSMLAMRKDKSDLCRDKSEKSERGGGGGGLVGASSRTPFELPPAHVGASSRTPSELPPAHTAPGMLQQPQHATLTDTMPAQGGGGGQVTVVGGQKDVDRPASQVRGSGLQLPRVHAAECNKCNKENRRSVSAEPASRALSDAVPQISKVRFNVHFQECMLSACLGGCLVHVILCVCVCVLDIYFAFVWMIHAEFVAGVRCARTFNFLVFYTHKHSGIPLTSVPPFFFYSAAATAWQRHFQASTRRETAGNVIQLRSSLFWNAKRCFYKPCCRCCGRRRLRRL
jgi:hypothetical protein